MQSAELASILNAYGYSTAAQLTPLSGGLINQTVQVEENGRRTVLQRLHPIFHADVHLDIEPITAHLERKGVRTPRLIPTTIGELWTTTADGQVYRLLSFVEGRTVHAVEKLETARAAGAFVGRFHQAVSDLSHAFHFERPGAHDTKAHLAGLERALVQCREHPDFALIEPIGDAILDHASTLGALPHCPARLVHGDLKISNLLFNETLDDALAILDLDTMAHLTIPIELGDALRSWCNPAREDAAEAEFQSPIFAAALGGYAESARSLLTDVERDTLVLATETIALELAARFAADALRESYFGWDEQRYSSRSEHNRVRAASQLAVAESVRGQRGALERIVADTFG